MVMTCLCILQIISMLMLLILIKFPAFDCPTTKPFTRTKKSFQETTKKKNINYNYNNNNTENNKENSFISQYLYSPQELKCQVAVVVFMQQ